jgi:acetyl esterase
MADTTLQLIDSMPEAIQEIISIINDPRFPKLGSEPIEETRARMEMMLPDSQIDLEEETIEQVRIPRTDSTQPGDDIQAIMVRPRGTAQDTPPTPAMVWFHGGGWVLGSARLSLPIVLKLVRATGIPIMTVEYRLAPEHPFPAAVDDCFDAVRWLADAGGSFGIDTSRLIVGGDSAGGNLAAVCALAARDGTLPPIAHQLLVYPVTDHLLDTPSFDAYGTGLPLETVEMRWLWERYCPETADRDDWRVSPLRAESLEGLCPATLLIAEYDPLRCEDEAYAQRLEDAGVPLTSIMLPKLPHGSMTMAPHLPEINDAVQRISHILNINQFTD